MQCRQLHHINSGFYITVSGSLYPHLIPTSVHPCPFLPYISDNYIHRSLFMGLRNWPNNITSVAGCVLWYMVLGFCLSFFLGIKLWLIYCRVQTQICLSLSWSREVPLHFLLFLIPQNPLSPGSTFAQLLLFHVLSKCYSVLLSFQCTQLKETFLPFIQMSTEFPAWNG